MSGIEASQSRIARLLTRVEPADYLFCPVKGRSYVSNAAHHAGNRVVRCLDIRKYFRSTPFHRIYSFFATKMRCGPDVAYHLATIACYNGHLPTGSPLSPILSYYAYLDVWDAIAAITRRHGCKLSVYIDDVTISGPRVRAAIIWEIKRTIHAAGLKYHKEKRFVDGPAEITGVIMRNNRLFLPNRQHLKLRQTVSDLKRAPNTEIAQTLKARLYGLQAQKKQVSISSG